MAQSDKWLIPQMVWNWEWCVLGTMLFSLFSNDISFNNDKEVGIKNALSVFVDDTKLCREITSAQDIGWESKWQMKFNIKKF